MGSKRGSMMLPSDFRLEDAILTSDEQNPTVSNLSNRMSSTSSTVTGKANGEGVLTYRDTLPAKHETRTSLAGTERSSQASSRYHSFISEQTSIHTFQTTRSRQTISLRTSDGFCIDEFRRTTWQQTLFEKNLIPTKFDETNWSDRGQHVEYGPNEGSTIDSLLVPKGVLGHSATALVEKVRCKRIMLARKKIRCNWRIKREDAIEEVAHLQRLSHAHVVRGVGTYIIGDVLSILLYPATAHNLETFLDDYANLISRTPLLPAEIQRTVAMQEGIRRSFTCLANTISFLHDSLVKHMDIKPTNILVQEKVQSNEASYKIYLADFGEARSYRDVDDVETDSLTAFTRRYAAPEVVRQDKRGFPADIFSLGCVFLEMLAVLAKKKQAFIDLRKQNNMGDSSYQANIQALRHSDLLLDLDSIFLRQASHPSRHLDSDMVRVMLDPDPDMRPTALTLKVQFGADTWCCSKGPEPFEAVLPAKTDSCMLESLPE